MIRSGMVVRTNDGTKVGRVGEIRANEFEVRSGILFKHCFWANKSDIVDVIDDELICRPLDLPEQDREIHDMPFGCAETEDELAKKKDEVPFFGQLTQCEHHH